MKSRASSARIAEKASIKEALTSIGVDKWTIDRLIASSRLRRIVVPIYSRKGVPADSHNFSLAKLPAFLRWFEREFPNGRVQWDPDYEPEPGMKHLFGVHVIFNMQEDDQDTRVNVRPTVIEEGGYQRKVEEYAYTRQDAVKAHTLISTISD